VTGPVTPRRVWRSPSRIARLAIVSLMILAVSVATVAVIGTGSLSAPAGDETGSELFPAALGAASGITGALIGFWGNWLLDREAQRRERLGRVTALIEALASYEARRARAAWYYTAYDESAGAEPNKRLLNEANSAMGSARDLESIIEVRFGLVTDVRKGKAANAIEEISSRFDVLREAPVTTPVADLEHLDLTAFYATARSELER